MAQEQFLGRFLSLFRGSSGANSIGGAQPDDAAGPRDHHYYFAHQYLPAKASEDAKTLVAKLQTDPATEYLTSLWKFSRSDIDAVDDIVISTGDLECTPIAMDAYSGVVVRFPQPARTLEAFFAAILLNTGSSDSNDHRYFTLELGGDDFGGAGRTMFCEWKDGCHINYGDGPEPVRGSFVRHLEEFISNEGL